MKDLLKDFNIESVIKHLSDQTIDLLVSRKCDNPKPDLDALRKDKKIRAIPCSRENPKILWVNDAEVVGY